MLEKEGNLKKYLKSELEFNIDTIPKNYDQTTCWLCEKEFTTKDLQ